LNRSLRLQAVELKKNVEAALQANAASLNLMEDAVEAQSQLETAIQELRSEIAERERAEKSLRLNTIALTAAANAVVITDHNGAVVWANPSFTTMTGYTLAEAVGKNHRELVKSGQHERVFYQQMWETILAGGVWRGELVNRRKDGSLYSEEMTITPVRDRAGAITHFIAIKQDLTVRNRTELALRQEHALLSSLITTIPDHIYFKDRKSRFTLVNEAHARLFGFHNPDEMIGKTDFDLFSKEHAGQAYADEQRIMETGKPVIGLEEKETWPDGHITWVSTTKMPLRNAQGCVTGIIGLSRDITEKKQLEEHASRLQRLENLGMLSSGIAHDFNNALAPIVMAGPLLRQGIHEAGALRMLDIVEKSANRGAALVRQMLSFARGTGGAKEISQIQPVLREVTDLALSSFPKSIHIETRLPDDIWPIVADPTQMYQVFLNLCVNSRDAMPEGGELTVTAVNRVIDSTQAARINGGRPGKFVAIEVRDTGSGIPSKAMEKIFEPFFTTKGVGKGTGLGLSTVRGITTDHFGFIEVGTCTDSESAHGTVFTVYLPAMAGAAGEGPIVRGDLPPRGHGELILLVDDEESVLDLGTRVLADHGGYTVARAHDGAEAITIYNLRASEVRALVTDMDMPFVNGRQLITALRKINPTLPVIIMSGGSMQSEGESDCFVTDYLIKPFEVRDLLEKVRNALEGASSASPMPSRT
jgi:PAS domain S-box-containing protein